MKASYDGEIITVWPDVDFSRLGNLAEQIQHMNTVGMVLYEDDKLQITILDGVEMTPTVYGQIIKAVQDYGK